MSLGDFFENPDLSKAEMLQIYPGHQTMANHHAYKLLYQLNPYPKWIQIYAILSMVFITLGSTIPNAFCHTVFTL